MPLTNDQFGKVESLIRERFNHPHARIREISQSESINADATLVTMFIDASDVPNAPTGGFYANSVFEHGDFIDGEVSDSKMSAAVSAGLKSVSDAFAEIKAGQ